MSAEDFLDVTLPAMDLVYNIARKLVPRREDAEDLVQETYLAAYRAWREHRRPRKVEPWLATICLNLGRSSYRRRARGPQEVPWQDVPTLPGAVDPAQEALDRLSADLLHRALWAINEDQRLAIALVDLAGFTTREAARIAGVPRGTILSRLHRGRKALAHLLERNVREREEHRE
jgi:RNA polymerase sigma-70 factor (ECF subfamily)